MKRRARQLYFPLRVPRQAVAEVQSPSVEARRIAVALREASQDLIDFSDRTKPPDVIYPLKKRELFRPRTTQKETHP